MSQVIHVRTDALVFPFKKGIAKSASSVGGFRSHIRRLIIELVNALFGYDWVFWLVGVVNRRLDIIESVFLCYPATDDYTLHYMYARRGQKITWSPWFIGLLWQNGKLGVKFAITAHNGDFSAVENQEKLRSVVDRMEKIRTLFGAPRKSFAGILPGVLFLKRIIRETPEADLTAKVIVRAIEKVRKLEGLPEDAPVIVLGGRGFIGKRVVAALPKQNVYSVDIVEGDGKNSWPAELFGRRLVLVNISLKSALEDYVDRLWPGVVVLNEVYPEPSPETVARLIAKGCTCFHIAGVVGKALPNFPGAYEDGIPCCAAWPAEAVDASVVKL